jgi:hypothetical protein
LPSGTLVRKERKQPVLDETVTTVKARTVLVRKGE